MPGWKDDPAPRPRPPRRRTFLQRLGHDLGFGGIAQSAESRPAIDALQQYDQDDDSDRGLLSFIPGWVLIAALVLILLLVVFFTSRG